MGAPGERTFRRVKVPSVPGRGKDPIVIAILGSLAGSAIPVYSGCTKKAQRAADQKLIAAVNTAFAAACPENGVATNAALVSEYLQSAFARENPEKKYQPCISRRRAISSA